VTLLLKQLFNFFKLLNSDTATYSLAWGMALGCVLGFSPVISIQAFLVFAICFVFRVQLGAALFSAFFFKIVAYMIDPLADVIGRRILELPELRELFVTLHNMPLVPLTRFNNSIVMGSGIIGFALAIPLFFGFRIFILKYRQHVVARFQKSKLWKLWTTTIFYKWYVKYNELYGE
jgi:uncharacterized protein (TIGR03546 family)